MHGALLVDKPCGPTSHDVVAFARRALGTRRIGHTGTLDPLATGLLVLLVGHATRLAQFLAADEKEYIADVRLGAATPTYDAHSLDEVRGARCETPITSAQLEAALAGFVGSFSQHPPPFSAKKVDGVRAYERARKQQAFDLKPVEVTVHELEILQPSGEARASDLAPRDTDLLRLRIVCSAGFYVRSLAHDLGAALGCGAHLEALRRTRAGRFRVDDAVTLDVLEAAGPGRMISVNGLLEEMPEVRLNAEGLRRAGHGNTLAPGHLASPPAAFRAGDRARVLDADGEVLTVAEYRADGLLHPLLVLR